MYNCGLILEGGGMRGVYTAGVIDYFLEKGLEFSSVYQLIRQGILELKTELEVLVLVKMLTL